MLADRPHGRRLSADEERQLADLETRLLSGPLATGRPAGLTAARRMANRPVLLAAVVLAAALLVLATFVGGPGGLLATACALSATLLVCAVPRIRLRRLRGH